MVHAYVINLARSPERRAHMVAELQRAGLDHDIVPAVDGRQLDLYDRTTIAPAFLSKNDFPAGSAGCALSHLHVYRRVVEDGSAAALVLEDDVTLPTDLGAVVDAVVPHLTGAEVALLNYGSPDTCKMSPQGAVALPDSRMLVLPLDITRLVNAAAYVITRDACERMLERALPLRANADDWMFFYQEHILDRIRCVLPLAVAKSAQFESTIGLYSVGDGFKGRFVASLMRQKVPLLHQAVLYRRRRILRQWGRTEVVDLPFTEKPSRLG